MSSNPADNNQNNKRKRRSLIPIARLETTAGKVVKRKRGFEDTTDVNIARTLIWSGWDTKYIQRYFDQKTTDKDDHYTYTIKAIDTIQTSIADLAKPEGFEPVSIPEDIKNNDNNGVDVVEQEIPQQVDAEHSIFSGASKVSTASIDKIYTQHTMIKQRIFTSKHTSNKAHTLKPAVTFPIINHYNLLYHHT